VLQHKNRNIKKDQINEIKTLLAITFEVDQNLSWKLYMFNYTYYSCLRTTLMTFFIHFKCWLL